MKRSVDLQPNGILDSRESLDKLPASKIGTARTAAPLGRPPFFVREGESRPMTMRILRTVVPSERKFLTLRKSLDRVPAALIRTGGRRRPSGGRRFRLRLPIGRIGPR